MEKNIGYLSPPEEKNFKKNNKDKSALIINREKPAFFKVSDGILFENFLA